ncbi:MAG: YdcF family protein [Gemmatimonadota bacterium]|nr:YdcF family protein [Gemmatimonadota bacterium]
MSRAESEAHGLIRQQPARLRRWIVGLLAAVVALWIGSLIAVLVFAEHDGVREGAVGERQADAIVVLGAAQYAGRPSPVLRARVDHAIELWRKQVAPVLVLTGGVGVGDTTSEAAVSAKYAMRHGVPESAIVLETAGRTTSESIRTVAQVLGERDQTYVVLVSDPFHMFRLWILAHRHGLDAVTSPTRSSPIWASVPASAGYIFSESLKAPIAFIVER